MSIEPIFKFRFPFDDEHLLKEYKQVESLLEDYKDARYFEGSSNWLVTRDLEDLDVPYVKNMTMAIVKTYGIKGYVSPRFYFLQKKTILRNHIDLNTKCSINHVISGAESPVNYPDYGMYNYKTALLNTEKLHGVINKDSDRILFKISIFDESFEQVRAKLFDL